MKKIIKFIGILSSKLEAIAKIASILAIIGMLIVIILQIVARYIFASPPTWTEEIGKLLMIWGVILYHSPAFISRSLAVDFFGIQGVSVIWATSAVPCFIALIFIHNLAQLFQKHKKEPKT